jgi:hypothetical protein
MASIHCKCGEVQIKFTSQCPRVAVECCDKQAFNNIKFLAKIGEYEIPDKFPVLVYYFDNSLVVVKGIEKLFFNKLIVEANIVNMYTSCCHTFLTSLNPMFAPSTILVHGDRSHLTNIVHQKPTLRFFRDQLTEEERKQLIHDIPDLCREADGSLKGDRDGWEEVYNDFLGKVSAPLAGNQEGLSFEEILQQRSEPIFVFGWQSQRFARKTVAFHECTLSG